VNAAERMKAFFAERRLYVERREAKLVREGVIVRKR
jgi:hypothetical protein